MRALLLALTLAAAISSGAGAQTSSGFTTGSGFTTRSVVVLVGCDVAALDEPRVVFVQGTGARIGRRSIDRLGFDGDSCAKVLSRLLSAGFVIADSRPVRQNGSSEILVYDLVGQP